MPELSAGMVLLVASASIFAPLSGWLASQRRRNPVLWALFGIALGPVAAGLLLIAPPGRCAACRWPVAGWGGRCSSCGADVRTGAPAETATGATATVAQIPPPADAQIADAAATPAATRRRSPRRDGTTGAAAERRPRPTRAAAATGDEPTNGRGRRATRSAGGDSGLGAIAAASPELAPAASNGAPWSPSVQATGLGHRPEPAPAAPVAPASVAAAEPAASTAEIQIVGSGVYMGGSRPIETGSRYLLACVGSELQILGPVHLSAGHIADRLALADLDVFFLDGRLLIGGRDGGRDVTMAFVAVSLERGVDLERLFGAPSSPAPTAAG